MRISALFLAFFATCLAALPLAAQKKKAKSEIIIPERLENALLWEITGKGLKKPAYLFGTIHMIPETDFMLSEGVIQALDKSKRLVLEIDMSNQMGMALSMMKMAPMKDAKLKELISAEDYELVKTYFEKESKNPEFKLMSFSMIENWKPMLLQSMLYTDMLGGQAVKSYEMELMALAKKRKMTYGGLETVEDQMAVFDKIPYKEQAQALVEAVRQLKNPTENNADEAELAKMIALYKSQDIEGMVEMTGESMGKMGEEADEALLGNRNRNWIPKILSMAKTEPVFFAVGAAHLGGDQGVIRLLMREGYTLKPIKS